MNEWMKGRAAQQQPAGSRCVVWRSTRMEALPSPWWVTAPARFDGYTPQTVRAFTRISNATSPNQGPNPWMGGGGSHGAALCIKCVGYNYTIRLRFNCRKTATVHRVYTYNLQWGRLTMQFYSSIICIKKSPIADKPRDTFVQMQCCGWPQNMPLPTGVTIPNLLVPRQKCGDK